MGTRGIVLLVLFVSACGTDPSAVRSFSALTPDAASLHTLTTAYASVPTQLNELYVLDQETWISPSDLAAQTKTRDATVTQIDAMHKVLIAYMQSLGALAGDNLVQTSPDTKNVTDGLTELQKAEPGLGLTSEMIAGVGDITTFVADALAAEYREEQLSEIIGKYQPAFQQLIGAERTIVARGVIKELQLIQNRVGDLHQITLALTVDGRAEAARSSPAQLASGVPGLDPKLQRWGAANVASLFLLQRWMATEQNTLSAQIDAANAYLIALDKISEAHTVLYTNRNVVLSKAGAKATIAQLTPLIKEAHTALQALKTM